MLLCVDVGNTQTHLGALDGPRVVASWRIGTNRAATADELAVALIGFSELAGIERGALSAASVGSVVPTLGSAYREMCVRHLGIDCMLVEPGIKTGMSILTDSPRELGADRLINAVAAFDLIAGPCVVVDFGTAITFDAVSADGEYLGGVIGPGIAVSIEALASRAAKLPQIELVEPDSVIGKTTQESLQSGFVFGFAGAIDGIAGRIAVEMPPRTEFLATGGFAPVVVPLSERIDRIEADLTLQGLRILWERNR